MIMQSLRSLVKPIMGYSIYEVPEQNKYIYIYEHFEMQFHNLFHSTDLPGGLRIINPSCAAICYSNSLNWTVLLFSEDVKVLKERK